MGDKIGLSPLWVIFAVLAGASLMGFVGMLIALPVSAIINVLFHHAYEAYKRIVGTKVENNISFLIKGRADLEASTGRD